MTLKEVIDNSLALPDEQTMKRNMDFLQTTLKSMTGDNQQKMQAVIDGLKKTDLFLKNQKAAEEELKKQQQLKQPTTNIGTTAQSSNNSDAAQLSNTNQTAQISNN